MFADLSMFVSSIAGSVVLYVARSSVHLGCSMSGMANVSCLLQFYFNNSHYVQFMFAYTNLKSFRFKTMCKGDKSHTVYTK